MDELLDTPLNQSRRLHDGTFHHMFDGGWMWIIPFDNFHRSASTWCSIGLLLDPKKYPLDASPSLRRGDEKIISAFPSIQKQLGNAKAVRPYVRTSHLQYKSIKATGHRHFISNNVYGFIDPLYSSGLINSFDLVFYGAKLLLDAFQRKQKGEAAAFDAKYFQPLDALLEEQWIQNDLMVSMAYSAMQSPKTWHAWTQFWLAQVPFHDLWIQRHCFLYFEQGNKDILSHFISEKRPGNNAPFFPQKQEIMRKFECILAQLNQNEISDSQAAEQLLNILREQDWLPKQVYAWGSPTEHNVDFANPIITQKLLEWGFKDSPSWLRETLFDFKLPTQ